MQIHKIEAVDMVVGVKGPFEAGTLISMRRYHLFMLRLGIPAYIVPKVDTANANLMQICIVWVAVLPYVNFFKSVEDREQVVCLVSHQIMIFAIAACHFHFMLMREHSNLL